MRILAASVCLMLIACQDEAPTNTNDRVPTESTSKTLAEGMIPREAFWDTYCHAICDNVGECCTAGGHGYDPEACLTNCRQGSATLDPGTNAEYDETAAWDCVAAVTDAAQACKISFSDAAAMGTTCLSVYKGKLPPGSECSAWGECARPDAGAAFCALPAQPGAKGKCLQFVHEVPVGGVCSSDDPNVSYYCDADAGFCDATVSPSACVALLPEGDPCQNWDQCNASTYCDRAAKTCARRKSAGEACGDPWTMRECDTATFCDLQTRACAPRRGVGEPCNMPDDCAEGLQCGYNGTSPTPMCVDGITFAGAYLCEAQVPSPQNPTPIPEPPPPSPPAAPARLPFVSR